MRENNTELRVRFTSTNYKYDLQNDLRVRTKKSKLLCHSRMLFIN